jgi:glucose-6-phosphate 1-dehydrogenase
MMPAHYRIVGSGSPEGAPNAEGFRSQVRAALAEFGRRELSDENWEPFARALSFAPASSRTRSWRRSRRPRRSSERVFGA